MKDLMVLRDLLSGADVPDNILSVTYDDIGRKWKVHMREGDFREMFGVFNHTFHSLFKDAKTYRIEHESRGVSFFAITDEAPETDARIIASERRDYFAQVREAALLGDMVANARAGR